MEHDGLRLRSEPKWRFRGVPPTSIIKDRSILITGASGTFGNAFIKAALPFNPRKLIVYSRDELKQLELAQRFKHDPKLRFFLGDVRDAARLNVALHHVDFVIHAAALKQVPAAEYDTSEFIKTNILGTHNVLMESAARGVKKVLVLSSDKAAAPLTAYGATKAMAEHMSRGYNHYSPEGCRFSTMRYGNIAGSRGSVIPVWRKMLGDGAITLPLTHDRMSRFFFTIEEAVDLAIWSLTNMQGGELFVPKMPSFWVKDLAEAMGCKDLTITGTRGAEKIAEVMVTADEAPYFREWEGRYVRFMDGKAQGELLSDGFEYRSDNNMKWLNVHDLRELLDTLPTTG